MMDWSPSAHMSPRNTVPLVARPARGALLPLYRPSLEAADQIIAPRATMSRADAEIFVARSATRWLRLQG
jgi:hypothetical protein